MNALVPASLKGEVLPAYVKVICRPHPLKAGVERHYLPAGATLAEIVADVCEGDGVRAWADGVRIQPEDWATTTPARYVTLARVPEPFLIPLIPVIAAAVGAAMIPAAGITIAGVTISATVAAGIISAVGAILSLGLGMLFKPSTPQLKNNNQAASQTYSIGGFQNRIDRFGVVPQILGTHRLYPPYAAAPYTQLVGQDQYLNALFCVGYADIDVSEMKIGETPITSFQDVTATVYNLPAGGAVPSSWTNFANEVSLNIDLGNRGEPNAPITQTTSLETDAISIDLVAPEGVFHSTRQGETVAHMTANIQIDYRVTGTTTWTTHRVINLRGSVRGEVVRQGVYWTVPRGQYDVRVVNQGDPAILDNENWPELYADRVMWTAFRSHKAIQPVSLPYAVTLVYVRIRANEQLSGTLDTFNCVGKYRGFSFNNGVWTWNLHSTNPAAQFRNVLQGPANAKAVPDSAIDFDSLDAWAQDCQNRGWTYSRVHDFPASVFENLRDICAAGRGEPTFVEGKWGVIWERTTPSAVVQAFTPRNTLSFGGERSYLPQLHGVRVRFVNANAGYAQDEIDVYDDGFDANNADPGRVEGVEFPGVTDPSMCWKLGRYHLAQQRVRREAYTIEVDIEGICCRRGDRVEVAHDVLYIGLAQGRITDIDGAILSLDEPVTMVAGQTYGMRFRSTDGAGNHADILRTISTVEGIHDTVTLTGAGDVPAIGDMFMFGETDSESAVMRVKGIYPGADFSARIELVDDALDILTADTGPIPPFVTNISIPADALSFSPRDVRITTSPMSVNGEAMEEMRVSFVPPALPNIVRHEVQWRAGTEENWPRSVSVEAAGREAVIPVPPGEWQVRVRSHLGSPIGRSNVLVTAWSLVVSFSARSIYTRPPNVTGARIVVLGDRATLNWDDIQQPTSGVEIRHSRATSGALVSTARVVEPKVRGTSATVPAITGTYLLRWRSIGGTYSAAAAEIVTTAPDLIGFNVVEEIDEHPSFAGTKTDLTVEDDELSRTTAGTGTYDFANSIDLGEVFAVRLEVAASAYAEDTTSSVWDRNPIWGRSAWAVPPEDWAVDTEYRTTDDDPSGTPVWGDWKPINLSEVRGRAFEFRSLLTSERESVAVRVPELSVIADMPDRVLAVEDIAVPAGSAVTVQFAPAFKEIPAVVHSLQDVSGLVRFTNKTTAGVDVEVFDPAGTTSIGGTVDITAVGYGRVQA